MISSSYPLGERGQHVTSLIYDDSMCTVASMNYVSGPIRCDQEEGMFFCLFLCLYNKVMC